MEIASALVKGQKITVLQDWDAVNPFSDWDSLPELATVYFHIGRAHLDDPEHLLDFPYIPNNIVRKHWRDLFRLAGIDQNMQALREACEGRESCRLVDNVRDEFLEAFTDLNASDKLEAAAEVYRMLGIPALCTSSSGVCQGDYRELLLVCTPKYMEITGLKAEHVGESLESAAKLFRQYHDGECYGVTVESTCKCCGSVNDTLESCWGYYGDDWENNGVLDFVADACGKDGRAAMAKALAEA